MGSRRVLLIDTPGFDDTTKSDTDILKEIAAFLATSSVDIQNYLHQLRETSFDL